MTRFQKFEELSADLKKHCIYQGISYLYSLFSGFSVIFFIAVAVTNIISRSEPDLMFSAGTILASLGLLGFNVWVWYGTRRKASTVAEILTREWMKFYGGSNWKTYAGEIGEVVDVTAEGAKFTLKFADGTKQAYPFYTLQAVDLSTNYTDTVGLNEDGVVKFRLVEGAEAFVVGLVLAAVPVILWLLSISGGREQLAENGWLALPLFGVFGAFVTGVILLAIKAPDVAFDHSYHQYAKLVSSTTWKTLDGRVGVVRWASSKIRTSEGRTTKSEEIKLAFGDGTVETFQRADIHPTAFGCTKEA